MRGTPAFDVDASCLSIVLGLDAAAAVMKASDGSSGLRAPRLETWSEQVESCGIDGRGSRLP